ncbi:sulfite exporter TauE/SafE family protein [Streptomyces sp. NPDC093071]|uniref:sulfite exporter TauE/SafE family protein n=1 Tax=Streptomyces sp. NPDC093071 TaxID=3366022 RepID=UPI0037F53FCC
MSPWEALAVFAAGIGAGTINTIVGSGTLITFPVLLATGLPPITANVSNALGLVPGSVSGAIGYRRELKGQKKRVLRLGAAALVGLLLASMYGGYFGAAQGVLYLSLMGLLLHDDLQRINAVKNILGALVNGVAAVFFLFVADFDWTAVLLIAVGSTIGGQLGAKVGRRLSPTVLRGVIIAVGVVAILQLTLK